MDAEVVKAVLARRYENPNNRVVVCLLADDFCERFCDEEDEFDSAWFVDFMEDAKNECGY